LSGKNYNTLLDLERFSEKLEREFSEEKTQTADRRATPGRRAILASDGTSFPVTRRRRDRSEWPPALRFPVGTLREKCWLSATKISFRATFEKGVLAAATSARSFFPVQLATQESSCFLGVRFWPQFPPNSGKSRCFAFLSVFVKEVQAP